MWGADVKILAELSRRLRRAGSVHPLEVVRSRHEEVIFRDADEHGIVRTVPVIVVGLERCDVERVERVARADAWLCVRGADEHVAQQILARAIDGVGEIGRDLLFDRAAFFDPIVVRVDEAAQPVGHDS